MIVVNFWEFILIRTLFRTIISTILLSKYLNHVVPYTQSRNMLFVKCLDKWIFLWFNHTLHTVYHCGVKIFLVAHWIGFLFCRKKCIRIVCGSCEKVNGSFQHTKPMFFKLKLLTVFNLSNYFCGCFAMRILNNKSPGQIFKLFNISERSDRLILPRFKSSKIMYNNFVYNASKILNFLYDNAIPYNILSPSIFKKRLKDHLLNMQNRSIHGDASWLQCNHSFFSNITFWLVK